MKKFVVTAAFAALFVPSVSQATIANLFGGDVVCTLQVSGANAGERHCSGLYTTFDGSPIDVNIGFPPAPGSGPDGNFPIIGQFHGWGGSKSSLTGGGMQQWIDKGYAVLSISDRGWGSSCGGLDFKRTQPQCLNGYNHLLDLRYEVRDVQEILEDLADQAATGATGSEGLIEPTQIGVHGGSYGGMMSMSLAVLKDRKMMGGGENNGGNPLDPVDGYLVPWMSPGGKSMAIAAAQPDIPPSDLAYSLQPNGHNLDYVENSSYTARGLRVGIMKQSFVSGFYAIGAATSNYAPTGTDPDADVNGWYALVSGGEPYDNNPVAADVIEELSRHHSAFGVDDSIPPAPMLISNGWADDIFPVDEALRIFHRTRTRHPGTPISVMFTDHGHQRGQNKSHDGTFRNRQLIAWMDYYVRGIGPVPYQGVQTLTQTCTTHSGGATGPYDDPNTDLPFQATTWDGMAPGELQIDSAAVQVIANDVPSDGPLGQAFDPISGGGACASSTATDQTGAATYRSAAAPVGGWTLMGSPTIIADILSPSPNNQIAARLLDVDPATNRQTLVARGVYRPEVRPTSASCQVFQLHPNGWHFAEGHIAKLELLPNDTPYGRETNGQTPITLENLRLRLPVIQTPDSLTVFPRSDKILPDGYTTLASDVTVGIDTTSCVALVTTTTTSTTSTTLSTTTTTLQPGYSLSLKRGYVKAESTPGKRNGKATAKGHFTTPPVLTTPPGFTVVLKDSDGFAIGHTFENCTAKAGGKVLCSDADSEGEYKAKIVPRSNTNQVRVKAAFKKVSTTGPFTGPLELTLIHNDVVFRQDTATNCNTKANRIRCKQTK